MAASLGRAELVVFHTALRVIWASLALTGAVGAATGLRLAGALASGDPARARRAAATGLAVRFSFLQREKKILERT